MLHIFILDTKHKTICPWARHVHSCHFGDSFCPPGTRTVYVETADHQRGPLAATVLHVYVTGGRSLWIFVDAIVASPPENLIRLFHLYEDD